MNKKELIARCEELGIDPSALTTNAQREAAIEAKEAELAKEPVKSEEAKPKVESSGETSSEEAPQANGTDSGETGTGTTETVIKEEETVTESPETVTEKVETVRKTIEIDTASQEPVKAPKVKTPKVETPEVETEKEDPAVYTDGRGRRFRFTEKAPKTMNIDGHPMTQAEILQSDEVISELVHGNNSFLTQIN